MTMPKKGRRNITVNGVEYHYTVKDRVRVVINKVNTNEIIKWERVLEDWEKVEITPEFIENIILKENNK